MTKMKTTKYAVLVESQHYGFGKTIMEAATNCKIAGASSSERVLAYLYIGTEAELKSVCITSYGDIEHPECVISTRLFGPKDSKVRLSAFLK